MYNIEEITGDSIKDIQTLFRLIHKRNISIDYLKWKYNTEAFGLKPVGFLAKDTSGHSVAYYWLFPVILHYKSIDCLAAQEGDAITAPQYQRKGLFVKLARKTYQSASEHGIKIIYGFPNKNSYIALKNGLGRTFTIGMQNFNIKVKLAFPFCGLVARFSKLKWLYNKFLSKQISKYRIDVEDVNTQLFNYAKVSGWIKRDANFFRYKTGMPGVFLLQINGFQMLVKVGKSLLIGDVATFEPEQGKLLMNSVKKLARIVGCRYITFAVSDNHWLCDMLKKNIEPKQSIPMDFYVLDDNIEPVQIQFSAADYDYFKKNSCK